MSGQISDNYLYDKDNDKHLLIELKSGGDLDNKKARAEKTYLLRQYFILKNKLMLNREYNNNIEIYFATAYNKYGESNPWKQANVKRLFSDEELLIGKDYWNKICKSSRGFDVVFDQYKKSARHIREGLKNIKNTYFN